MIDISLFGQSRVKRLLEEFQRQTPFATALALTRIAQDVKKAETGLLKTLDRPTPYTLRAIAIRPATKERLESRVFVKDESVKGVPAAKYLMPQYRGGRRRHKSHEKLLQRFGQMPSGWYAVPGKDVRLNRYGNVTGAQITKILSDLRSMYDPQQNRAEGRKGRYFVMRNRYGRATGVYERVGKKRVKSILHYVRDVHYRKRLDFDGVAVKVIERRYKQHMIDALGDAFRSRRRGA